MTYLPLLSLLIGVPIIGGLLTLAFRERVWARPWALMVALFTFCLACSLYGLFDSQTGEMQFMERLPWINAFGIKIDYALGVDGVSVALIGLNTLMTVLVIFSSWHTINDHIGQYFAAFLIMTGLVNGVFMALDAILFYVFFEGMLIPMFLVIGMWGGPNRVYATLKFFLYTFLGSVFLLVSLVVLYQHSGSFYLPDLYGVTGLPQTTAILIFLSFLFAFGVKVPMWPVHTWLPDAHVEAPTGGSVILAAIALKVGGYGFYRFLIPILPDISAQLSGLVIALSLIAIIYIALIALVQTDMKKLIAYSSIAHMGFVTMGPFLIFQFKTVSINMELAVHGAVIQMISHGFVSAALFFCIGILYERMHTREIKAYVGVANRMPVFASFFVLFAMANLGLPGTSGFIGEFFVIFAAVEAHFYVALAASSILVLGAAYTLWLVKRVIYGKVISGEVDRLPDLNRREYWVLGVLAVCTLLLGVWPAPLLQLLDASISSWIDLALPLKTMSGGG